MKEERENKASELESVIPQSELNTDVPVVDNNESAGTEAKSHWSLFVLVLLTLALLSVSYYLWSQQQQLVKKISGNGVGQLKTDLVALNDRSAAMSEMIITQAAEIEQQKKTIGMLMKKKQNQQAVAGVDVNLLEVESLLRLAKNRYELTRDIETSLLAMQLAASYLQFHKAGALQEVNLLVKKEISTLMGLQVVDVNSFLSQIDLMLISVDSLKLSSAKTETQTEQSPSKDFLSKSDEWSAQWEALLKQIKPMLTIRRNVTATPALLSLEEASLVKTILKSRYENLRMAIIHHDEKLMRLASHSIRQWINRYYKVDQQEVIKHLQILDSLQAILENIQYPPIGEALVRLKDMRLRSKDGQEKPADDQTNISTVESQEVNMVPVQ